VPSSASDYESPLVKPSLSARLTSKKRAGVRAETLAVRRDLYGFQAASMVHLHGDASWVGNADFDTRIFPAQAAESARQADSDARAYWQDLVLAVLVIPEFGP